MTAGPFQAGPGLAQVTANSAWGAGLGGNGQATVRAPVWLQPIFRQLGKLYYAWHLFCRSELIVLPWDGFGLLIALAEVSSLLQRPREKVG